MSQLLLTVCGIKKTFQEHFSISQKFSTSAYFALIIKIRKKKFTASKNQIYCGFVFFHTWTWKSPKLPISSKIKITSSISIAKSHYLISFENEKSIKILGKSQKSQTITEVTKMIYALKMILHDAEFPWIWSSFLIIFYDSDESQLQTMRSTRFSEQISSHTISTNQPEIREKYSNSCSVSHFWCSPTRVCHSTVVARLPTVSTASSNLFFV